MIWPDRDDLGIAWPEGMDELQPADAIRAAHPPAGLTPWPRPLHNLRASRETELAAEFPLHVVTRWLGNIPRIAMKHYLQVTEDDFARAAGKATASPESLASDTGSAAPGRNPVSTGAPNRKKAPHTDTHRTKGHPRDHDPADLSGTQGGDPWRDPPLTEIAR